MNKAAMITVGLTVVAVLIALFVAKLVDNERADKIFR